MSVLSSSIPTVETMQTSQKGKDIRPPGGEDFMTKYGIFFHKYGIYRIQI